MVNEWGFAAEKVNFSIGDFRLRDVSLAIPRGEYFVLAGPNGAGKTVFMRIIAGLFAPDSGSVAVGGTRVEHLPPWLRDVGYVPQEGILFPNRNVRGNIAFGLEARKKTRKEIACKVEEAAEMMEIGHLLSRRVEGLSGGERQKVSIARALVIEPALLLLDEPVSAIDEDARDTVCSHLKSIQKKLNITTIHVSHNSRETALVADRVGVMRGGELHPEGTP